MSEVEIVKSDKSVPVVVEPEIIEVKAQPVARPSRSSELVKLGIDLLSGVMRLALMLVQNRQQPNSAVQATGPVADANVTQSAAPSVRRGRGRRRRQRQRGSGS